MSQWLTFWSALNLSIVCSNQSLGTDIIHSEDKSYRSVDQNPHHMAWLWALGQIVAPGGRP